MTTPAHTDAELDEVEAAIDRWLDVQLDENPTFVAVEPGEAGERRRYVRMRGEAKDVITIWLTLRQRMLHYETYVMPAPEENERELYELLLRRNDGLVGAHFSIGHEDAVYLRGALPVGAVSDAELDRIVGSVYAYVERCFPSAIRLGFASKFAGH